MGALDHKAARGPSQPSGSQNTRDVYSQMMLYRSRSPSPCRGDKELSLFRGQAARKGKSSVVSGIMARMAYKLERETMDRKMAVLGVEDPRLVDIMIEISGSWFNRGLYGEAEALEVKIVDLRKERLGLSHSDTLKAMGNVAVTWQGQGRHRESESIQLRVYNQRLAASGEEDLATISTLLHLAASWRFLGRYIEAEQAQRKVVEGRVEALGLQHEDSIEATSHLARTLSRLGRLEEAEEVQTQVLEATGKALGLRHRLSMAAMSDLAATWNRQGRYHEAESMQHQVLLELRQEVLGATHPATLSAMYQLALTWYELERYEEIEGLMNWLAYMQQQRQEGEARAEVDRLNLPSTSLSPLSDALDDPHIIRHLQRMFSEDEALEARTFELPEEEADLTSPNMTATTILLSSPLYDSRRVYEIFDEEEDDQRGSERGRKGKAAILPYGEQLAEEAFEDERGEKGKETLKGVESWKEAEETGIETEGEDIPEAAEAALLADIHPVPEAGEDDNSSEDARREETPLSTLQAYAAHEELQAAETGENENDDPPESGRLDEVSFTTLQVSTVHDEPEAGEIDDTPGGRRLHETASSTPQDSTVHEKPLISEARENDDNSQAAEEDESPPIPTQAMRYPNSKHRLRQ